MRLIYIFGSLLVTGCKNVDFLTFVLAPIIAVSFMSIAFALVHGHLGNLLPVVGILHIRHLFAKVLLLGKAFFAHLLVVLHRLVLLRVLLVSIVCPSSHTSKYCEL